MNRKKFIKNSILATAGVAASSKIKAEQKNKSTYDKLMNQVGFNHLPVNEIKSMKTVYHKASTRGHANHGWLNSYHSFSFASYYNPERMNFGVLRVLNDDQVAPGMGFGTHPHDNMEIISIPLEGDLEHKDSMGNKGVIKQGDVQVMSAGTGIQHSEYNRNKDRQVKFLQIWIFPNKKNVTPRYDQMTFDVDGRKNKLQQILSPTPDDEGVWIHQDAWFHMGKFDANHIETYQLKKPGNGIYVFVIDGDVTAGGQQLEKRDGLGVWDMDSLEITATTSAEFLIMEIPMQMA